MKKLAYLTVVILLTLSVSCVPSLHPLYTDEDVIFDPDLVGRWSNDDSEIWDFAGSGGSSYDLAYTDGDGRSGTFEAHLLKIGGKLFLDLYPEDAELKESEYYQLHFLKVHTFLYVKQITPTLQMAVPDMDWLEDFLEANPGAIRHEKTDDYLVLTASTEELQRFWLKHLDTEGAIGEVSDFTRMDAAVSEEQSAATDTGA